MLRKTRAHSRKLERELEAVRDGIEAEVAELEALKREGSARLRSALLVVLGTPESATVYRHQPRQEGADTAPTPIRPEAARNGRELSTG